MQDPFTDCIYRIYKSKYMDDGSTETLEKDKKRPDTAISKDSGISADTKPREEKSSKSKDEKSSKSKDEKQGRSRSRSIWGKKEKPTFEPMPTRQYQERQPFD